jgi:threonine/homoserine/homoserine lactone efflux protein
MSHVLAFAVAASVIIAIPGPSVMFIVGRALAYGRRAAVLTVVGNTLGAYVQVSLVAIGIGLLLERSIVVFDALKLAGAAYLVFLGIQAVRHRGALEATLAGPPDPPRRGGRLVVQGFVVGASNPKSIVFLTAILPQFVSRGSGHVPAQILILGLVYAGIALLSDSLWGVAAGAFRSWFARSPRRLQLVGGVGGLAVIAVGVRLALTGRRD